jgi:hypothetical protein
MFAGAGRFPRRRRIAGAALRVAFAVLALALVLLQPSGEWPLDPSFFSALAKAGPVALFLAPLAAALFLVFGARLGGLLERVPRWIVDLALGAIAFYLARKTMLVATHGWPQVQDEIAFDRLARRMALGHPIPATHPLAEFFRLRFFVEDGRSYPVFQPGWPAVLAVGHRLHVPTLVPPFATAAFVIAVSRLAERLYGRLAAVLAGGVLVSSGFVIYLGASYFSHVWAAALYAFALERIVAMIEADSAKIAKRRAVVAGLAVAWLLLTRIPTLVAFALPLLLFAARALERLRERPSFRRPFLTFALVALLGPLGQIGWNLATTRHPFELPQDKYFALSEPKPDCHRVGFGPDIGCPHEHPGEVPPEGYTLSRAFEVTRIRWQVFRTDAFGSAVPLLLFALFCAAPLGFRGRTVLFAMLGPPIVYFGFYYHGIQHGARFYTECMGPLAIALAVALARPFAASRRVRRTLSWRLRALLSATGLALVILTAVYELGSALPEQARKNGLDPQPDRVKRNLDLENVHGAIVYVANCIEADRADLIYGWPSVIAANPPESGDRWLARDFGPAHDRQLVTMYPERRHVRVTCHGRPLPFDDATPSPRLVTTEIEGKFPMEHQDAYGVVNGKVPEASEGGRFTITFRKPGAWIRFPQHLFLDASYLVSLTYLRRFDGGRFAVAIDGVELKPAIDGRGSREVKRWTSNAPLTLSKGMHAIELRSLEGPGTFLVDVDQLELAAK